MCKIPAQRIAPHLLRLADRARRGYSYKTDFVTEFLASPFDPRTVLALAEDPQRIITCNFPDPIPTGKRLAKQIIPTNSKTVGAQWYAWYKPTWAQWIEIFMIGNGGGGGDAVAGAASTAGGGGGGGSGGMTRLLIPAEYVPDVLYVSVAGGYTVAQVNNITTTAVVGISSYVSIVPTVGAPVSRNVLAQVNPGASGGKSNGGTAGPVGTAGAVGTAAQMALGFFFAQVIAGQVGIIGGAAVAGGALTLPVTGLLVTGGTGGGGLGAANVAGKAGGLITGVAGFSPVPIDIPGGGGGTTAPTAGGNGVTGFPFPGSYMLIPGAGRLLYAVGGTGGGSCGLTAAPAGSTGGNGGAGGIGSGGGGGGAAFTASAFGVGGLGGDGLVAITAF